MTATKSVIAGSYDFTVQYDTCKELVYIDYSTWGAGGPIESPVSYTLGITNPGGSTKDVQVNVMGANKLTAQDLDFSGCIPSGEYVFTAKAGAGVGPNSYSKTVLILCSEQCGLNRAISQLKPHEDNSQIRKIQDYIAYAKNAAELGNMTLALEYQRKANRELRKIDCHCMCV